MFKKVVILFVAVLSPAVESWAVKISPFMPFPGGAIPQPLEIVDIRYNGQSIPINIDFNAPTDWLIDVEFVVRNTSKFTITNALISLVLDGNTPFYNPATAFNDGLVCGPPDQTTYQLKPSETMTLKIKADKQGWARLRSQAIEKGYDYHRMRFVVEWVLLSDDRRWYLGQFLRRNPKYPKEWDVIQ